MKKEEMIVELLINTINSIENAKSDIQSTNVLLRNYKELVSNILYLKSITEENRTILQNHKKYFEELISEFKNTYNDLLTVGEFKLSSKILDNIGIMIRIVRDL
ncbi:hypothetical protein M3649_04100 [Ureibacillus chungkukjangi]|uniref:hypothetical protein n=1 Tax=Ureibacillus chungkukjangi TaxID=1202712 RepID=UPI002040195C|nr:hypothetical protein [Ureibacillus chungkukjangi]MCM3387315.1 hypothetical protein [Ureibacillus chungkukjangi]